MRRYILSAIAASVLSLTAVNPVMAQKNVSVRGAGSFSCAVYVQAYDAYRPFADGNEGGVVAQTAAADFMPYEAWIQGYLFGVDSWNKDQIRSFDRAGLQLWVYNYCQKHPLDIVANAALAFYRSLGGPIPTGGDQPHRQGSK
jgi:hypothetical protein